uniref:8.9 kDa family member n=1 Tax=Rhipicephalus zambeziensis TaxID=60191 RepID=A0A224Y7Y5_9ACAR
MKHLVVLLFFSLLLMVIAKPAAEYETSPGGQKEAKRVVSPTSSENGDDVSLELDDGDSNDSEEDDEEEDSSEEQSGEADKLVGNGLFGQQPPANCTVEGVKIPHGESRTVFMKGYFGPCIKAKCSYGVASKEMCRDPPDGGSDCFTVSYNDTEFPDCCFRTLCP